jgi:dTDP-4-amino-4,6-dideoxygalactose transaminase
VAGIAALARARGVALIEDASQTHGARLAGRPVGTFADLAVFSTMFGKHHCTGGQGGVVYTRDEALYWAVRRASDRGKSFGMPAGASNAIASLNLNLSELGAAIGLAQLDRLPRTVETRRMLVRELAAGLAELRLVSLPPTLPGAEPSYWFLRVRFHAERATCDKQTFCQALAAEGVPVMADYRAVPHTMDWFVQRRVFGTPGYPWTSPDYRGDAKRTFPCPNAHAAIADHFVLHVHEGWGTREVDDCLAALAKLESAYLRA